MCRWNCVDLRGRRSGSVLYEAKVPAEVDLIVASLRRVSLEIRQVGLEAGIDPVPDVRPAEGGLRGDLPGGAPTAATLAAMRNKTDRNDARGLAQILRSGWYRTVHVKSLESHQVRALLTSRKAILVKCVNLENELRGLLKIFGVRLASHVAHRNLDQTVRAPVMALPELARACCRCSMRACVYQTISSSTTR